MKELDIPVKESEEQIAIERLEERSRQQNASELLIYLWRYLITSGRCCSQARMDGKTVIITGGNSGIGKEAAKDLVLRGARVIIACRDTEKGEAAANEIRSEVPLGDVTVNKLDLSSFESIRSFAHQIKNTEPHVHILINNAGVAACPKWKTEDGFEMQFGVNHLGHFMLTLLLLDKLKASVPARIINVSSIMHTIGEMHFDDINLDRRYGPIKAYCQSKLSNLLFTRELARRLKGTGITVYGLHPGTVQTQIGRHVSSSLTFITGAMFSMLSKVFFKTAKQGAQTTIYCAVEEGLSEESGYYYSGCRRVESSGPAKDDKAAEKLWRMSEEMTGLSIERK